MDVIIFMSRNISTGLFHWSFLFAPDLGVDHDLAERNIQILRADYVTAAVSGGLFVLLDRYIVPSFV